MILILSDILSDYEEFFAFFKRRLQIYYTIKKEWDTHNTLCLE